MKRLFSRVEWNIGFVAGASCASFLEPGFVPNIHWLPTPKYGSFLADPFLFEYGGRTAILCERFEYLRGKAHIAALEIAGTSVVDCGTVIESRFHLSYPCVFEFKGEQFCVPEAKESGRVDLYRMLRFPDRWERIATILEEPVVDPTIFPHEGLWWMLGTSPRSANDTLYAWYAESPMGPWVAHKNNPLKIDRGSARPGGKPFVAKGALYRPAQDCTSRYGQALALNRIDVLTPERFEECLVSLVPAAAGRYGGGMHTLNSTRRYCIVDGQRDVFAIEKLVGSVIRASHKIAVGERPASSRVPA